MNILVGLICSATEPDAVTTRTANDCRFYNEYATLTKLITYIYGVPISFACTEQKNNTLR